MAQSTGFDPLKVVSEIFEEIRKITKRRCKEVTWVEEEVIMEKLKSLELDI